MNILNNGLPSRICGASETCIDLTISSASLQSDLEWEVMNSPGDSDHCPIIVTVASSNTTATTQRQDLKNVQWEVYRRSDAWNSLEVPEEASCPALIETLYQKIAQACEQSVPKLTPKKYLPKPWWTPELTQSKRRREHSYQNYRRNRTERNLLTWRRNRARHKTLVAKSKKRELEKICGNLKYECIKP